MSLYGDYIKERENFDIVETFEGFATFQIEKEDCYLRDIYVDKASRKGGAATRLADSVVRIGKNAGCKRLLGSISLAGNGCTDSMKVFLAYGMKILRCDSNLIVLFKEI